ncbi:MAG: D-tyrosyl-tRNA(Tyr) deacylase [Myxococcota bacterium]|jgi:D-tyrosyl-tRNA(Tyr) deacylase
MRAVIQRVSSARVTVSDEVTGDLPKGGLLVLLGVGPDDTEDQGAWLARKLSGLRIFADDAGKMNLSVVDAGLGALVVSQFTLYGDCRKGRRPSFAGAGPPSLAEPLYERFCEQLAEAGVGRVERGRFAADMQVSLVNDGPVTLILEAP